MNWRVEFDKENGLALLTYRGLVSTEEVYASSMALIDLTNRYQLNKILVEAKKLRTNATRLEIFKIPDALYKEWGMNPATQIAIIEPRDISVKHIAHFYELASRNLGWNAKIFADRKSALKWLASEIA